ncbi:hypothetical protein ACJMK2_038286 [Sinanodonta woodiana]|uniref:peptidyl-tRNA hydrolase n=1 Tax=Sinanodonta woodiana TaxID=1069815 RepID=A0ABD3WCC3_SINWO
MQSLARKCFQMFIFKAPQPNVTRTMTASLSFKAQYCDPTENMARRTDKYLIVGLGNHDFPNTRHSVGMQVVDKIAAQLDASWQKMKACSGFVAIADLDEVQIIMLKPKMPMNVNGTSVSKTAQLYNIQTENVYLLHDDIDKKLGQVAVKDGGSANGHNGVRSVINSLGSDNILRIKIGIDRPTCKDEVAEYVLSEFPAEEQTVIDNAVMDCLMKIAQHMSKKAGHKISEILCKDFQEAKEK